MNFFVDDMPKIGKSLRAEPKRIGKDPHPEERVPLPGKSTSYAIFGRKIDKPLQFNIDMDGSKWLKPEEVKNALDTVLKTWNKAAGREIFVADSTFNEPKMESTVGFGDLGRGTVAWCNSRTKNGVTVSSEVMLNTRCTWTADFNTAVKGLGRYVDLQTLLLHELGHAAGLGDLYSLLDARRKDMESIMNYYDSPAHYLGAGDINGLKQIYI